MAADKETREVEILLNAQQANASIKDMAAGVALMNNQLAKMSQDDPRRQQLQRDFQVLTQRVGAARAEMRTYVQTEEEMRAATEKLNKENVEVILNGQKINSSFKEMKASAALLEKQLEEMNGDDPGRKKMLADYHAMQDRMAGIRSEMKGATESTGFLKQGIANAFGFFLGGGLLDVVQKIFGFFTASREEFIGSAKSSADLEATLHATKNAAGLTADEIRRIGEERAKVTLFDDDETNRASAMLLTFKNVKKGVFEDAIPAIQDLATKMAGDGPADMKGASIQLGKALNDPLKGITALTRVGVTFTDQQKEQIAAMVKMGNTAGAQKLILAELNSEFGGAAEAARKAAGGMATLSLWFGEFKETVGGKVNQVLEQLGQWFGRVLDNAQPLVDMVTELVGQFADYYREIGDVLEGLGLFNEKTDTAKIVVEVLKTALTILLMPLRMMLQITRSVIDNFIEWYNASELLRGVLGGLGALVTSLFLTIKDDAIKILGGVGDIIVGIFTLDKDKIVAGFKSALAATADVALSSGQRAAEDFMKGYEANKNNHIKRTVRVNTEETTTSTAGTAASGGGEDEPAGESEKARKAREAAEKKAQAARDKADRDRIAAMKAWIKQEGNLLEYRNTLKASIDTKGLNDDALRAEEERQKVMDAATKKVEALTGLETDYTEQVAAIVADRDLRLRELWDKHAEEEEKRRQDEIDKQIAQSNADAEVLLAEANVQYAAGLLTEQEYQDGIFAIKQAAMLRELALIKQRDGQESVQAKKQNAEILKAEADHVAQEKKLKDDLAKFEQKMQANARTLLIEGLALVEDNLDQQSQAYTIFKAARKAAALADIGISLVEEIQNNSLMASKNPLNAVPGGAAIVSTQLAISNGLAVVRALGAGIKIAGFAKGGATGDGAKAPGAGGSLWDIFSMANGMSIGSDGKLRDESGFRIAGVVHEDEYVIPKWMRQDPQVMQMEGWLEQRRLQGYAQGGATTEGGSQAQPGPGTDESGSTDRQLVAAIQELNKRLVGVEQWATQLEVVNDLLGMDRQMEKLKKVKNGSAIRPK